MEVDRRNLPDFLRGLQCSFRTAPENLFQSLSSNPDAGCLRLEGTRRRTKIHLRESQNENSNCPFFLARGGLPRHGGSANVPCAIPGRNTDMQGPGMQN